MAACVQCWWRPEGASAPPNWIYSQLGAPDVDGYWESALENFPRASALTGGLKQDGELWCDSICPRSYFYFKIRQWRVCDVTLPGFQS